MKLEHFPFTINARVEKQNSVLKDLSHNPRPYSDYKWCSPPPGSLKINCNASVREKKKPCIAAVGRRLFKNANQRLLKL